MTTIDQNIWPKKITVDKRIISILSQSTYDSFPLALKELITNSYDADSREVFVTVDVKNETIIIRDDGRGMDDNDFEFYLRIAGKTRKKENNKTPSGRQIIGQFGVGFLSVFPFFKSYKIESKKVGAPSVLYATIPLFKYFSDDNKLVDIGNILINGGKKEEQNKTNQSYTEITLTGFNELTRAFFHSKSSGKIDKNIVETYSGIDKLKWILADDLPLKFRDDKFNEIFDYNETIPFNVYVNKSQLFREIYGDDVLETHSDEFKQIGKIKCKYCIVTPRKSVKPYEARYLKIRNLNVGIGDEREHFGVGHGTTRSRLHWLTGEVHIIEGMNDVIKVSRDGFNYSKDYEELMTFFNKKLNFFSNRLEEEAVFKREIKQTGKEFRVNNLKLLDPKIISQKVKKFEDEGYKLKEVHNHDTKKKQKNISISSEKKEIELPSNLKAFEKHIIIKRKKYRVMADAWDYEDDLFPACKLDGNKLIINTTYPLFEGKKYTDIFVKMHMLILVNYNDKKITKSAYKDLLDDVLVFFSDYLKT